MYERGGLDTGHWYLTPLNFINKIMRISEMPVCYKQYATDRIGGIDRQQSLPLDLVPVDCTKFAVAVLVPGFPRKETVFFDIVVKFGLKAILILEGEAQVFWDSA